MQALIRTGLPAALCRLVVRAQTPPEQKLQALTMLRVLVNDPATHVEMVECKVLHALVQQVSAHTLALRACTHATLPTAALMLGTRHAPPA